MSCGCSVQGWAVGDNNTILFTADGGASWVPQQAPTETSETDWWSVRYNRSASNVDCRVSNRNPEFCLS
eukprot:816410-Prorocentrum_minimum.AAC.2